MLDQTWIPDVYGPGTHTDKAFAPVPRDAERIFRLLAAQTPGFTRDEAALARVRFGGADFPVLPGPIKLGALAAALHGMLGVAANEILELRGLGAAADHRRVVVDTTHATLWLATVAAVHLGGETMAALARRDGGREELKRLLPDWERGWHSTPLKRRGTGIYATRTPDVWYCLHGSLDPPAMLRSLGIDPESPDDDAAAMARVARAAAARSAEELEMGNLLGGFCGSICFTPAQWRASAMGRALAARPLVDVTPQPRAVPMTPPVLFLPPLSVKDDKRPLAGVRVVEMTRVIAGPQVGALLAALGADVVRVSAPHLRDLDTLQLTLNAGKRTVALDLREPADRRRLLALVEDADVFVQGFRPGSLARCGLGFDDLLETAARRGRGVVYVAESCYGADGYYAQRPGWQQTADCASGAAFVTGRALGLGGGECVLPPLPASDMLTGLVGAVGAVLALRDRAVKGGSYQVHAALVAADACALSEGVGLYAPDVVAEGRRRFGWCEMRAAHHVLDLLRVVWDAWTAAEPVAGYLREDGGWFQTWDRSAFGGRRLSILRPVVRFVRGEDGDEKEEEGVTPRWNSASVPHGYHKPQDVSFGL